MSSNDYPKNILDQLYGYQIKSLQNFTVGFLVAMTCLIPVLIIRLFKKKK